MKSEQTPYFPIFPWIQDKLSWKQFALIISEIFRLFVNTITPDDKYSHHNMKILLQQLQTPLSHKEKIFFGFFIAFPKYARNSETSLKKEEHASLIITEIIASERDVYLSVWKVLLQNTIR